MNEHILPYAEHAKPVVSPPQKDADTETELPSAEEYALNMPEEHDELEEVEDELSDERAMQEDSEELALAEEQLARIRDYAIDALARQDHLEAVVATTNADLAALRVRYSQGINAELAAESFSLDAFEENSAHVKQLLRITSQVQQFAQLELNIIRRPQRDPFGSHRVASWSR